MSDPRPIGIFDSGVGGLTVVSEIGKLLPREEIIYFGDTARVPYGTKSKETVTKFSVENIEFLMEHDVKMVVVACNTASSLSLNFLKRCFRVPVIGVIEPGAKSAASVTRNNRIGVIGTHATISSGAYEKAVKKISSELRVFSQSCPLFVPLVEEGWLGEKVTLEVASIYLGSLKRKRIDTLILGCTHYPLLKDVIRKVMGGSIVLIDSARSVAEETQGVLDANGLLNSSRGKRRHRFFVSDEPDRFIKLGMRFLKRRIECVRRAA
ncbi:MAG: glutamate racemase [Candidatus Omnitrophica bacterium]|nr:glutamate racemase [Candidatus Omnitrophota bacterium]MBI5143752.1 glutamate racemase [Candidatus Omnitrophota bacterium]